MNKKTYKAPSIDRNEALVKLNLYEDVLPLIESGPGVDDGFTKERDTYNYKYEDETWGTISHSIW